MNNSNALIIIICSVIAFGLFCPLAIWIITTRNNRVEVCNLENYYPQVGPIEEPAINSEEFLEPLPTYEDPPNYDEVVTEEPANDHNMGDTALDSLNSNPVINDIETTTTTASTTLTINQ